MSHRLPLRPASRQNESERGARGPLVRDGVALAEPGLEKGAAADVTDSHYSTQLEACHWNGTSGPTKIYPHCQDSVELTRGPADESHPPLLFASCSGPTGHNGILFMAL